MGDVFGDDISVNEGAVLEDANLIGHVFKLSNIARPGVVDEHVLGVFAEFEQLAVMGFGEVGGEFAEKQVDVFLSLAQFGHADGHGGQSVI